MNAYLKALFRQRKLFLLSCDAFIVLSIFCCSYLFRIVIYEGQSLSLFWKRLSWLVPFAIFIHIIAFYIFELYDIKTQKADAKQFLRIILSVLLATGIIILASYIFPHHKIGRVLIGFHVPLLICTIFLWRKLYFSSISVGGYKKNFICIGNNPLNRKIVSELQNSLLPEYSWVGTVTDYSDNPGTVVLNGTGIYPNLETLLNDKGVQAIVLLEYPKQTPELAADLIDIKFKGFEIFDFPTFHQKLFGKVPVLKTRDSWILYCHQEKCFQPRIYLKIKHLADVALAVTGLILSFPLLLLSALAVKFTSKGPVFFTQERLGLGEKPFTLIKFRTMVQNAEKDCGPKWSSTDDPRITTVGKFLRKTRMDEIPQLVNIFKRRNEFCGSPTHSKTFCQSVVRGISLLSPQIHRETGHYGLGSDQRGLCGEQSGSIAKIRIRIVLYSEPIEFF